ncbi:DUF389 domain-containing protein [Nocardioides sp. URHA0032]|uniref:DUF389 domain-containing protein n=1 Tax=Nocardioides sp. URHA0032 TaxID=1380388 RepID=UPI00055C77D0|nr:DUF389 domain-containing protein [Nocardioides sp. URHA0032]
MVVHFRLTSPPRLTAPVVQLLRDRAWITNLTLQEGVVLEPPGDLVECDVAREKAGDLLRDLDRIGLCAEGGVVVTTPTGTPFERARRLEAAAPGHPDDAVIWEAVEAQAEAGAVPTVSYHLFLVLAVALASIAVITDSAVLVVGAMVVGPEYSAVAAASAGIALRRPGMIGRGLRLLLFSFAFAIAVIALLALFARWAGLVTVDDVTRARPNTGFIWHPDQWSFVVALLAGAAGALALAVSRSATMVGVFISVTTVPAAGNLALGLAFWERHEIDGSAAQLALNITGMVIAGAAVLLLMRWRWTWVTTWSERVFGRQSDLAED